MSGSVCVLLIVVYLFFTAAIYLFSLQFVPLDNFNFELSLSCFLVVVSIK